MNKKVRKLLETLTEGELLVVPPTWKTPATNYPSKKQGSAEIAKDKHKEGLYLMEGVAGYDFYYVEKEIPLTVLKINGETAMVDDPMHWFGMKLFGEKASGKVLVGGLGLGLITFSLDLNPFVEEVDIIELNKDVIKLVKPFVPKRKIKIRQGNVYDFKWFKKDYDTIILDLWVRGEGKEGVKKRG